MRELINKYKSYKTKKDNLRFLDNVVMQNRNFSYKIFDDCDTLNIHIKGRTDTIKAYDLYEEFLIPKVCMILHNNGMTINKKYFKGLN